MIDLYSEIEFFLEGKSLPHTEFSEDKVIRFEKGVNGNGEYYLASVKMPGGWWLAEFYYKDASKNKPLFLPVEEWK